MFCLLSLHQVLNTAPLKALKELVNSSHFILIPFWLWEVPENFGKSNQNIYNSEFLLLIIVVKIKIIDQILLYLPYFFLPKKTTFKL